MIIIVFKLALHYRQFNYAIYTNVLKLRTTCILTVTTLIIDTHLHLSHSRRNSPHQHLLVISHLIRGIHYTINSSTVLFDL
jgi:hypothetical protein